MDKVVQIFRSHQEADEAKRRYWDSLDLAEKQRILCEALDIAHRRDAHATDRTKEFIRVNSVASFDELNQAIDAGLVPSLYRRA